MEELKTIYAISPIDGRYASQVQDLKEYFSEYALIKYRIFIEIKWLIKLFGNDSVIQLPEIESLSKQEIKELEDIFNSFSEKDALRIKEIENRDKARC